jgi:hypothetical protein
MAASMKMAVFWLVVPCSPVKFTFTSEVPAASIIRRIALMMEAATISETSVNFYRLHIATAQKTAIFILAAVKT